MSVVNPVVQLLESGNLVLKDDPARYIWQTFDYPTNTRLPDMKLQILGLNHYLTSWKNTSNPSIGDYSYGVDLVGIPQFVLRSGSEKNYAVVINTNEVHDTLLNRGINPFIIISESLNEWGELERFIWDKQDMKWSYMSVILRDKCNNYNHCGVYGICNIARYPPCECLRGFKPISRQHLSINNWTDGCVRKINLECGSDIFVQIEGLKLPDMINFLVNKSMSLEECDSECKRNCSCTTYANSDVREGGSGCILWFDDIFDIRHFSETSGGQTLFLRLASSEGEPINKAMKEKSRVLMKVLLSIGLAVLAFSLVTFLIFWKIKRKEGVLNANERQNEALELPLFDLITLETATNNFSHANKIGEGGYGPVYKGKTLEGQEIAVKRLSKDSGQGIAEFRNEVMLIAKLQHRNLVKLLGCCIQGEEKILVYDFGTLVLEIICGKRNRGFNHENHHHKLLGHAWILWSEGNPCDLMKSGLEDSNSASSIEVLRCIQVGLLCVQKLPEDRPCMSVVVFMLSSENLLLPEPKQPGFFVERGLDDHANTNPGYSENQMTISLEA
ncbi:hypothetical protein C5167_000482, partial [Papaver somniferum]